MVLPGLMSGASDPDDAHLCNDCSIDIGYRIDKRSAIVEGIDKKERTKYKYNNII